MSKHTNAVLFNRVHSQTRVYCLLIVLICTAFFFVAKTASADINCGNHIITFADGTVFVGSPYTQASYYAQTDYYTQSEYYLQAQYYAQSKYYTQSQYYTQAAYINPSVITVMPKLVKKGSETTVTWDGGNASSCRLTGGSYDNASVSVSGSADVVITAETTFTIECFLGPRQSTDSAAVKIIPEIEES